MALFNFIETFFFISLAITFLLILLLVYHFKQRLGATEHKCDGMFEIVNNIVKELNVLRNAQINAAQFSGFQHTSPPAHTPFHLNKSVPMSHPPFHFQQSFSNNTEDANNIFVSIVENDTTVKTPTVNDVVELNDDDSEDEYDSEDDSEDDSDDEYESDYDSDAELPEEIIIDTTMDIDTTTKVTVQEDETFESITTPEIKVITIDETVTIPVEITEPVILVTQDTISAVPEIQVEKLENTEFDNTEQDDAPSHDDHTSATKEIYRKMNIHTLKTLVITKGLCSDPSKMKKPELIKLLETITE